jgi:hypothetical protein
MLSVSANSRNEIFAFPVILFVIIRLINIRPKPFQERADFAGDKICPRHAITTT